MAFPDIRPAVAAGVGASTALKAVVVAGRVGFGGRRSPSSRQRSMKCSCAAERSLSAEARHLEMNSCGVTKAYPDQSIRTTSRHAKWRMEVSGVGVVAPSALCKHARFVVLRPPPQLCNISQLVNYDTPCTPVDLTGLTRCSLSKCIEVSTTLVTASWIIIRRSLSTAARKGCGFCAKAGSSPPGGFDRHRYPAQTLQELSPAKPRRSPSEVRSLGP